MMPAPVPPHIEPRPPMNPFPLFHAPCAKCGKHEWSTALVPNPAGEPFTYHCHGCADPTAWLAQTRHNREEFLKLEPQARRDIRVSLYGVSATREIEAREALRP